MDRSTTYGAAVAEGQGSAGGSYSGEVEIMALVKVGQVGAIGVNRDLSAHELPHNAWTDASNVRFLDGYCHQFYGHGQVYGTPSATPQHVLHVTISGARYWIYATAAKTYCTTITGGAVVETDITHATPRTGVVNQWTSTALSGIPILNVGDTSKVPMSWDLNTANKFVDLANWPAGYYCKALRAYKNSLVALNVTIAGTNYPYMVLWSHPADPGAVPASWDTTDATKDAGKLDLAEGGDIIVDGMQLRDSFIIYKERSVWRMDYTGGPYVYRFSKVLGTSGALNRNCIVEIDGQHLVLTGSDVVVHDGQQAQSVLDKETRRYLFANIDTTNSGLAFVSKNPHFNEVFVCYPSIGATSCDKAMVWNFKDNTVSFRTLPNVNHMAYGPVDNTLSGTWAADAAPWASDLSSWDGPDYVPATARAIMASADTKLFMLDSSAAFDGSLPVAYIERRGLSFDDPESMKLVKGIRARIVGETGATVLVYVGSSTDPYADPTYSTAMTHTIGSTIQCDCFVTGRYISIKFATGTAYTWRLDSYDINVDKAGGW